MHLHRNPSVLQRNVVSQRVVYIVHVVILCLQQKRRRSLAGDRNIRIQPQIFIGSRRMRNHKLFGALLCIPLRRGQRQMARINSHCKIGAAALFVGGIDSRIQTLRKMRAHRCHQMTA
jgi:hypothetical protein